MQQDKTYSLSIENNSLKVPNELRISFLCGVRYSKDEIDKRNTLKKYLDSLPNHRTILLEKYFGLNNYAEVGLYNLYDVETMVGCFSDSVIVIHESLSTAAEIGMLTSDKTIADKTLVLYPDQNSTEEEKISGFIYYAYYFGAKPILGNDKKLGFDPLITRSYTSNEKFTIHTSFPGEIADSKRTKHGIDSFLGSIESSSVSKLLFNKLDYEKPTTNKISTVDYWIENNLLQMRIHPMGLRCLLFSVISIDEVKDRVESCAKLLDVVEALEDELNRILLRSTMEHLGESVTKISLGLKGIVLSTFHQSTSSDVRKATGLFVILLEAMGYLHNEKNEVFKLTNRFKATKSLYQTNIEVVKDTTFKKYMDKANSND